MLNAKNFPAPRRPSALSIVVATASGALHATKLGNHCNYIVGPRKGICPHQLPSVSNTCYTSTKAENTQ